MFVCVSLNPALDKRLKLGVLQLGKVNRACNVEVAAGGKAAHVAMVLQTLGAKPVWLGFTGGASGAALVEGLRKLEIHVEAVSIAGATRMNLEIIEDEARVTEVLEPGPRITGEELTAFEQRFQDILAAAAQHAIVTLSGSLPPGVPTNYYATLIAMAHKYHGRVLLDTSGEALQSGLAACPDFVKPNQDEAERLSGRIILDASSAADVLKQFIERGAGAGAISLGADGLVSRSKVSGPALMARVPKQASRSCVGSGDASLAGFALAAQQELTPIETLRLSAACGVANCLAESPGRARAADIERFKREIQVETLE